MKRTSRALVFQMFREILLQNTMMGIDDGEQKILLLFFLLNIAPLKRVKSVDSLLGIHLIIDL